MSIVRVNEFTAAAEKSAELFAFLQVLVPYISGAEGCISCELLKHHEHGINL
jgi:quinol monooxygenase YgiN